MAKPKFFNSPAAFRARLRKHHKTADELLVGFHKKHTDKPSMTWPESVAEALCFGWIDGVRRRIDDEAYSIRFTPRRRGSKWSAVNVKMYHELEKSGRMTAAGRKAFAARPDPTDGGYSYEDRRSELDDKRLGAFKKRKAAWRFFEAQPPGHRRTVCHWVMSAKREETRDRRLAKVIEASAAGKRLGWSSTPVEIRSGVFIFQVRLVVGPRLDGRLIDFFLVQTAANGRKRSQIRAKTRGRSRLFPGETKQCRYSLLLDLCSARGRLRIRPT